MFSQASVILFTGGRGVSQHALGQTPPLADNSPLADTTQADTRPLGRHPQTASAAHGTHPTGMHSCLSLKNSPLKVLIM